MDSRPIKVLVCLTALFCLLASAPTVAGSPTARSSASVRRQVKSVKKQLKKLKKQVKKLKAEFKDFSAKPGPQGPQGPQGPRGAQGVAPTCQGNNASDKMVKAGTVCIDRYEASVWSSPTGGTQYGASSDNYPCDDNGQDCKGKIYARSVAGVKPSADITWFQAQQALANSGKRLPTNAEWQQAVAGTPDSTACNVSTGAVQNTGANAGCISDWGANDMVGNVWEWVADWDERAAACANWPAGFGSDLSCVGSGEGDTPTRLPGALYRGGSFIYGTLSGPFAVVASNPPPSDSNVTVGFRGAR